MTEEEEKLHKHIEKLEEKIRDYEKRDEKLKGLFNKFLLFLFKIFIGKGLKDAFYKLFSDLREKKNITTETLSELAAAIVRRFTRIGLLSLIVVATPIVFAILQYWLLSNQNKLIAQQNTRIEQQTYLQEASRRGALVFLMGNIFDEVNSELREDYNKDGIRNLSPQLIGRIIALSNSLIPYRFLEGDSLTNKEYSPERGQLLITLVNSAIDTSSLFKIFQRADFTGSYLGKVNLVYGNMSYIDLQNSKITNSVLENCTIDYADLRNVNFEGTKLNSSSFKRTYLMGANLCGTQLMFSDMTEANLDNVLISKSSLMTIDKEYLIKTKYSKETISKQNNSFDDIYRLKKVTEQ